MRSVSARSTSMRYESVVNAAYPIFRIRSASAFEVAVTVGRMLSSGGCNLPRATAPRGLAGFMRLAYYPDSSVSTDWIAAFLTDLLVPLNDVQAAERNLWTLWGRAARADRTVMRARSDGGSLRRL